MLLSQKFSNNMLPLYIMTKYRKKGGSPMINESTINEMAEGIKNKLKTKLEAKEITIGDVRENIPMMRKAMPQIVSAMSDLLQKMQEGNEVEQKFAKKIIKNRSLLSNFLTIDIDGTISDGTNKKQEKKRPDMQGGNGDDDTALACQSVCSNLTALNAARQSIADLRVRMQRDGISEEERANLQTQLNQAIMIGVMTEQRQQLLDALKNQQNWNKCRQVCNIASKFFFTGLSGFTAIMILRLVSGAAGFITGTASGVVSLISIGILNIISAGVNTVTNNIPIVGRPVMDDGRAILGNFTSSVVDLTDDVPEVQQFMDGLEQLGYTSQIIAFLILFAIFMIFFHLTRIVASADSVSLSVPLVGGINVGNQGAGNQLLNQNELQVLQDCPMQPSQALETKTQMLQGPDGQGGGKKRRKRKTRKRRKTKRRKRKTKRKTKKRKRHRRKKKKSTRKR
jgi:ABC-type amino acid transport system permease subunit